MNLTRPSQIKDRIEIHYKGEGHLLFLFYINRFTSIAFFHLSISHLSPPNLTSLPPYSHSHPNMPLIKIDLIKGRSKEEVRKLADVVQEVRPFFFPLPSFLVCPRPTDPRRPAYLSRITLPPLPLSYPPPITPALLFECKPSKPKLLADPCLDHLSCSTIDHARQVQRSQARPVRWPLLLPAPRDALLRRGSPRLRARIPD